MKNMDYVSLSVQRGDKDFWRYTTCFNGERFYQYLTSEKAAGVLIGLRSTPWKEHHMKFDNKEVWRFAP